MLDILFFSWGHCRKGRKSYRSKYKYSTIEKYATMLDWALLKELCDMIKLVDQVMSKWLLIRETGSFLNALPAQTRYKLER